MSTPTQPLGALTISGLRLQLETTIDAHFSGLFDAMHAGVHPVGTTSASFPPTALSGVDVELFARRFWLKNRAEWTTARWWLDMTVFDKSDGATPIGMQVLSSQNFADTRVVSTASWLTRASQGRGFGSEMRRLAVDFAFGHLGAELAVSEAFPENRASERVSICGYSPAGTEEVQTAGGPVQLRRYKLQRSSWDDVKPAIHSVSGFDTCRHLFGI